MTESLQELVSEQKKTNELLQKLVTEQMKKDKQESRRYWIGIVWHTIPLILTAFFLWQTYTYVHEQVNLFQNKFTEVQNNVTGLNLSEGLRSLFN